MRKRNYNKKKLSEKNANKNDTHKDNDNGSSNENITVSKMISVWSDRIEKDGAQTVFTSTKRPSTKRIAFGKKNFRLKLFVRSFTNVKLNIKICYVHY